MVENLGAIIGGIGALTLIGILFYGVCIISADEKEQRKNRL